MCGFSTTTTAVLIVFMKCPLQNGKGRPDFWKDVWLTCMQAGTVNTITIWLLRSLKKNMNATGFTWVHLNSWKIKAFLKFWIWMHILWEFPLECDPDIWAEICWQWQLLDFKLESIYVSERSKTTSSDACKSKKAPMQKEHHILPKHCICMIKLTCILL